LSAFYVTSIAINYVTTENECAIRFLKSVNSIRVLVIIHTWFVKGVIFKF